MNVYQYISNKLPQIHFRRNQPFFNLHMSKREQLYTKPQKAFKIFDKIEDQIVFSWQRRYETINFTITIIELNSKNLISKLYIIVSNS